MSDVIIDVLKLGDELARMVFEAKTDIYDALEDGLDEAEKILIDELKERSPKNTGTYAQNWKSKYPRGKYSKKRYVHNPVTVVWGDSEEFPLSVILEYSTAGNKRPHVDKAKRVATSKMRAAIEAAIAKKIGG